MDNFILEYLSLDSFPDIIVNRVSELMKSQVGNNYDKMIFTRGYSIALEDYYNKYPERLNLFNNIIPRYVFHYVFSDTTVGIKKYELRLGIDYIGQIIFLDFPHSHNFSSYSFLSLDNAISSTDSLTQIENYRYDDYDYNLRYDTSRNDLIWYIYYSRIDTLDSSFLQYNHLNFEISTRDNKVLRMDYDTSDMVSPIMEIEEDIIPITIDKN
jgi:hypothetical protein